MGNFAIFMCITWTLLVASTAPSWAESADLVQQKPRVASLNLCTDTLLLQYADPEQIASLTWLSLDKSLSPYAEQAQAFHHNRGNAEDILQLDVDLVLTGASTAPATRAMLQRLNIATVSIADANSTAAIATNITRLTQAIAQRERGERAVGDFVTAVNNLKRTTAAYERAVTDWPLAAFMQPNGLTVGPGTLSDELLRLAGFRNAATTIGLRTYQQFPLESLLRVSPQLLVMSDNQQQYPALAQQILEHPALAQMARKLQIASADLICGTTRVLRVAAAIANRRVQIEAL